jgi:hypothetical protein
VAIDDSGWGDDDPEYLMARVRGVVAGMSKAWRGRPLAAIEAELHRRLLTLGHDRADDWAPELVEHLARHIGDPHWPWKHPRLALDLSRRYNAAARARTQTRPGRVDTLRWRENTPRGG